MVAPNVIPHRMPPPNSAFGHPTNLVLGEYILEFPVETSDDKPDKMGTLSFQQDMVTPGFFVTMSDADDINSRIHDRQSNSNVNRAAGFKNRGEMSIVGMLIKAPQQKFLTITVDRLGGSKPLSMYSIDVPIIDYPPQGGFITFHYDNTFASIVHLMLEVELQNKKTEVAKQNPPKNKKGLR